MANSLSLQHLDFILSHQDVISEIVFHSHDIDEETNYHFNNNFRLFAGHEILGH